MPRNATVGGDGFRIYQWAGATAAHASEWGQHLLAMGVEPQDVMARVAIVQEPTDVLSVTSIKTLAGEHFQLVAWKISNVVNLAMGVRKQVRIGPRGGVKEVYVKDGPFPGEFVARMMESRASQEKIDDLRRWLRSTADEPRDIAAVRGSVVHKMIEMNATLDKLDEPLIRKFFDKQWAEEKRKVKPEVIDEDIHFVENAMRQYWEMRSKVPFVIIAQEPQVWNLETGYAGSFDVLMWFLGDFEDRRVGADQDDEDVYEPVFVPLEGYDPATDAGQKAIAVLQAKARKAVLTIEDISAVGGNLTLGDWKTSKGVYTSHVIQTTAYLAADFVGRDGVIDFRLTDILNATMQGAVIHIRPNFATVDWFDFRGDVLRGYLGCVAYARLLAFHKTPTALFTRSITTVADGTDPSQVADESE